MIKITTDITSMFKPAEGKAIGIDLVPMTLIAGDKSYREIEEINVDELKVLIEEAVKLTTSQPAVGEVMDLFELTPAFTVQGGPKCITVQIYPSPVL